MCAGTPVHYEQIVWEGVLGPRVHRYRSNSEGRSVGPWLPEAMRAAEGWEPKVGVQHLHFEEGSPVGAYTRPHFGSM